MGRHSEFTQEMADAICDEVASGSNLSKICEKDDRPNRSTIYKWFRENEDFANDYARARDERADHRADKIDAICAKVETGDLEPNAARVIIDALKWQAGKEKPQTYGDKSALEVSGKDGAPLAAVVNVSVGTESASSSKAG